MNSQDLIETRCTVAAPPADTEHNVETIDRYGNVLPTIIVSADRSLNWKAYDYSDLFLSQMDTVPSIAEQNYINYITDQYVAADLFERMLILFPFVGNSGNNNALNLRYPFKTRESGYGYYLGSPTHNSNGLTTGPTSVMYCHASHYNFENNNWHMSLYSRTNSNPEIPGATDIAFSEGSRAMEILCQATRFGFKADGAASTPAPSHTSEGSFIINSSGGANGVKMYKNAGNLLLQITNGTLGPRNGYLMIGAHPSVSDNHFSVNLTRPTSRNYAMASYGAALTAQQIIDKYTIDQAAQTILARQV